MYIDDTIAAISTPPGTGGIAIIRVSGGRAIEIIDEIYKNPKGKKLKEVKSHTIHYGHICSFNTDKHEIIDEVMVSVMKKPHTFTKEDIVEINCHGGIVASQNILEQVLNAGARLADPGEFTKRAFLNGRIDLAQAEAIIDIINSKTNIGLKSAVTQLEGSLSERIFSIREELVHIVAHLQAAVDFPEEDIEELSEKKLLESIENIMMKVENLIETANMGKIIREGLSTVIVGKPNVGKSSLLNALTGEKRAIVTEVPGTTRDIIEEYVNIKGVPLKIIDTAGIRETIDIVEKLGVEKSKEFIGYADLVILVLDASRPVDENDQKIFELIKNKKTIVLMNKMDLENKINFQDIDEKFRDCAVINSSILKGLGLDDLESRIKEMFYTGKVSINDDIVITNTRHKDSLMKARKNLEESMKALKTGMPLDMISIDIGNSIESLGEIVGLTVSEEIIDRIFHDFCLGK